MWFEIRNSFIDKIPKDFSSLNLKISQIHFKKHYN